MLPVLHPDLAAVARFLMTYPANLRAMVCDTLIERAHLADKLRKSGCYRPELGDGTLRATIAREKLPREPDLRDANFRRANQVVLARLAVWMARTDGGRS